MADPKITHTEVLSLTQRGGHIFQLIVKAPPGDWTDPGVFAKLRAWAEAPYVYPLLDRPISVHRFSKNGPERTLEFLIREIGPGTSFLAKLKPTDKLKITGPLGRGLLSLAPDILSQPLYLVAGGIGLAPMACVLELKPPKPLLFYGERSGCFQIDRDYLASFAPDFMASTEDGRGYGQKGLVTGLVRKALEVEKRTILACGPRGMLAALAPLARKFGVRLYVSGEAFFGCGLGVCLSCSLPLSDKTRFRLCQEGPVIDGLKVDWDKR
ncbi:MAG: dihydroorotate dehydrogenase electron transfer subunit [Deltaproteobacteria bacterium]|jgi:dihydroorotate dehydrogenase electron transfer subunit|nr:dihydroorotate dehydrogenase electron transfer subunit [Deltaproteobacteria bacterium]